MRSPLALLALALGGCGGSPIERQATALERIADALERAHPKEVEAGR